MYTEQELQELNEEMTTSLEVGLQEYDLSSAMDDADLRCFDLTDMYSEV